MWGGSGGAGVLGGLLSASSGKWLVLASRLLGWARLPIGLASGCGSQLVGIGVEGLPLKTGQGHTAPGTISCLHCLADKSPPK